MKTVSYILIITCLIGCLWPATAWATGTPPDAPATEELRLSSLEAMRLADALFAQGKLEEAERLYTVLLQSQRTELRIEALFKLGNIYAERRKYADAIQAYLAILKGYPKLTRVRLELARVYFWDKDFEKADFHFRLAQGDKDLPPEVNEKIDAFLAAIRRQKNWSLSGNFAFVPDSNLNSASGERRECVQVLGGMMCRELEDEKSGVGIRASLAGSHYLRINRRAGIKSTAALGLLDYPGSRFDDNYIYASTGPRLTFDRAEISLRPAWRKRWVSGSNYSDSYGAEMDFSFDLARRVVLDAGASYMRNHYHGDVIDNLLNGHSINAYLESRYILNNKSFVSFGLDYGDDETKLKSYGSRSWTYSLGYFNEFPLGITAYTRLSWTDCKYKEQGWFIAKDGYIEDKRRRDGIFQGYLRLSNRHWEYLGFTPAISYTYTLRNSNVWNNDYDKHRVEFSFRQNF